MEIQRETFVINGNEYYASKIAAFPANGIILKLQKLILPVLGGMNQNQDVKDLFAVISEKLDETVMTDIILPMFRLAVVSSKEHDCKIDSDKAINKVFGDADGLADMYELIFEVLKYNFAGFFTKLAGRFGLQAAGAPKLTE